jgi:hypothetical protein
MNLPGRCMVALCPHCRIWWPVWSRAGGRFEIFEHARTIPPLPYRRRWEKAWKAIDKQLDAIFPLSPWTPAQVARVETLNERHHLLLKLYDRRRDICEGGGAFVDPSIVYENGHQPGPHAGGVR